MLIKIGINIVDNAAKSLEIYMDRMYKLRTYLKSTEKIFTNKVIVYPEINGNKWNYIYSENIKNVKIFIGLNQINRIKLYLENDNLMLNMEYEENTPYQKIIEDTYNEVNNYIEYFEKLYKLYFKLIDNYVFFTKNLELAYIKFYKTNPEITNGSDIFRITEADDINNLIFYKVYEDDYNYCFGEMNDRLLDFISRYRHYTPTKRYKRVIKIKELMLNQRIDKIKNLFKL